MPKIVRWRLFPITTVAERPSSCLQTYPLREQTARRDPLIHPSAWKKNSRKFAVASIRRRLGVRGSGWGYAGFLSTIVDTLVASVARICCELSQAVAFQLPENLRAKRQNAHRIGEDAE